MKLPKNIIRALGLHFTHNMSLKEGDTVTIWADGSTSIIRANKPTKRKDRK